MYVEPPQTVVTGVVLERVFRGCLFNIDGDLKCGNWGVQQQVAYESKACGPISLWKLLVINLLAGSTAGDPMLPPGKCLIEEAA